MASPMRALAVAACCCMVALLVQMSALSRLHAEDPGAEKARKAQEAAKQAEQDKANEEEAKKKVEAFRAACAKNKLEDVVAAIRELERLNHPLIVKALLPLVTTGAEDIRVAAVNALSTMIGRPAVGAALISGYDANKKMLKVKLAIVNALAPWKDPAAFSFLGKRIMCRVTSLFVS